MEKKIIAFILCILIVSCASYNTLDLSKLTTGMTKAQVIAVVGAPQRVLAVNETREGYQEILEYRTRYDEVYALEFWNDYLTGFEFLYDDVIYTPPPPPLILPPFGRPVYIIPPPDVNRPNYRPERPSRPTAPSRPDNNTSRPNSTSRPDGSSRPGVSTPSSTTRPSVTTRPSESVRP